MRLTVACMALLVAANCARPPADQDWPAHGGDAGHTQSSAVAQITTANVSRLQVAWTYRSGDARPDGRSQIQCNPIVVHGVLYATSPQLKVFALDAATGRAAAGSSIRLPPGPTQNSLGRQSRRRLLGERRRPAHPRRGRPAALRARREDGQARAVVRRRTAASSLKEGLGDRAQQLYVLSNTPGAIYQDLLIIGTRLSEGPGPAAPGHIRAYDVRTGKMRWMFQTIPHPGEFGYDTWPADAWTRIGGANAWSGISVDTDAGPGVPADRLGGLRLLGRQSPRRRTCSPTRCWCSRPRPASGCGTTSSCTTISGIATCPRRRCWSR